MKTKQVIEFGPFRLDPVAHQLWRGDQRIALTPKVLDTLRYMVDHPGRLLTKEELLKAVWPDRFVDEANLTQNVSVLRRALGELESGTKYIGTFHGRGYQFLAEVRHTEVAVEPDMPLPPDPRAQGRTRIIWLGAAAAAVLLIIAAGAFLFNRPAPIPFTSAPIPLTRLPGSEYQPALSRDGTKVAFVWDQAGQQGAAIYVKGPEDDEPRRISPSDHVHDSPAWSPDGKYLAYLRQERDALKVIVRPERGEGLREVARLFPTRYGLNCRHLDWSPDGRHIVVDDKDSPNDSFGIYLIDITNGRRTLLAKPAPESIGDVEPRFSPDGRLVSFVRMATRFQYELFTVPVTGGAPQARTADNRLISGHDWAPDGSAIYFGSNRDGGFRVWRASVSTANLVSDLTPTSIASANPIQLSVARTGNKLVYSDLLQDLNIWRLHLSGAGKPETAWTRVVASTGEDILPYLSPDGTRLCFLSDRSGEQELWITAADGTAPMQLTRGHHRPVAGRWSPDGKTIVYHQINGTGVYLVDSGGGVPRLLAGAPAPAGHPVFTADGSGVFYGYDGRILLSPVSGGSASSVVTSRSHQKIPSADGRYLYFTAGRTETTIWRLSLESGLQTRFVDGLLPGYWGAWALGTSGLFYLAADENSPAQAVIRRKDLLTGQDLVLTGFPGPMPPIGASAWSLAPGDRALYAVRTDVSHSDVTLIGDTLVSR
ncbi:MAG: PD40 domain-containing protein [Bryobacterales bacterium]|nr:PD40 domain-containing protein [Bryobacterales bacterium]